MVASLQYLSSKQEWVIDFQFLNEEDKVDAKIEIKHHLQFKAQWIIFFLFERVLEEILKIVLNLFPEILNKHFENRKRELFPIKTILLSAFYREK